MQIQNRVVRAGFVLCACFALELATVPAWALHVTAYSKTDQKCRNVINKLFAKTVITASKVIASCHKARDAGKISDVTDCNDLSQADTGKFAKMQAKLQAGITKLCVTTPASHALLEEFISCPETCAGTLGLPNPLTDFGDVGQCLACAAGEIAQQRNLEMLGSPTPPLSKEAAACHAGIAKGYAKRMKVALKARSKCQKIQDTNGNTTLQPCDSTDPGDSIARATTIAQSILVSSCQAVSDLTVLDSCDGGSLAALETCLVAADDTGIQNSFTSSYQLPATICPVSVTLTTHAGKGVGGSETITRLDAGWTGLGHGQDVVDDFQYALGVSCNAEPPCGACPVTGYTESPGQAGAFIRCRYDTRKLCSSPLGTDDNCPDNGPGTQKDCSFFLGPPLPLSASNTPMCVMTRAETNATGTVNIETGEIQVNMELRAQAIGGLGQTQPCPLCINDTTPQDGEREGTCVGGTNHGLSCDVQGFDATFGNTSLDCPPSLGANISGQGLFIKPAFTTGMQTLPFGTKCDFPNNAKNCACAVCTNDTTFPCNSNTDCVSPGTCTSVGTGEAREPNSCNGRCSVTTTTFCRVDLDCPGGETCVGRHSCQDTGDGTFGVCPYGPDVYYCDGQLRANGKGYLTCLPENGDGDCAVMNSLCNGGDCGHCAMIEPSSCFLNPIVAQGYPDPDSPVMASVYCVPPTTSIGVNRGNGQPGPSRSIVQVDLHRNY